MPFFFLQLRAVASQGSFQNLHHDDFKCFQTEPSGALSFLESFPLCEAIFSLDFWRTGEKTGSFRILEISICSFWEMEEIFLSFKPIHDHWRCCGTVIILYSFLFFIHPSVRVLYTQLTSSGKLSELWEFTEKMSSKATAETLGLLNTPIIIGSDGRVQQLTHTRTGLPVLKPRWGSRRDAT